jgi:predicted house-cleaning noncanonical NTP pyrophosphatase (MazG superfamily)
MNQEQIKNWRGVLCGMLGPYALIMPDSDVIALRNKFQNNINEMVLTDEDHQDQFDIIEEVIEEVIEVTNSTLSDLTRKFSKKP